MGFSWGSRNVTRIESHFEPLQRPWNSLAFIYVHIANLEPKGLVLSTYAHNYICLKNAVHTRECPWKPDWPSGNPTPVRVSALTAGASDRWHMHIIPLVHTSGSQPTHKRMPHPLWWCAPSRGRRRRAQDVQHDGQRSWGHPWQPVLTPTNLAYTRQPPAPPPSPLLVLRTCWTIFTTCPRSPYMLW